MLRYQGRLYRALNVIWQLEPLSGAGAEMYGGRFNAKGTPALYTSFDLATAIRESMQDLPLQPTTVVSFIADIADLADLSTPELVRDAGASMEQLTDPNWREEMDRLGTSASQRLAAVFIAKGFSGMKVRSFAPGSTAADFNLVLWKWGDTLPYQLKLVDDQNRLLTLASRSPQS